MIIFRRKTSWQMIMIVGLLAGTGNGLAMPYEKQEILPNAQKLAAARETKVISFQGLVNGEAFHCGQTYPNIGDSVSDYQITDFRFYLHDVSLVTNKGKRIPLKLDQDGTWQYKNIAMVDFEDGCMNGTPDVNTKVVGTVVKSQNRYRGVCFTLGVPTGLNHIDDATAVSPLNVSGMLWSWTTGRKFVRIDGVVDPREAKLSYFVHLGSTGCTESVAGQLGSASCLYENTSEICLDGFNPAKEAVAVDVGTLLQDADLTKNTDKTPPGCMSGSSDPECIPVMPRLGIDYVYNDGINPAETYPEQQSFFYAVSK